MIKLLMALLLLTSMISSSLAEDQILKSVHNQFGPSDKIIEIKNIDLFRRFVKAGNFYGKNVEFESFELHVYVWSKYNLEQFKGKFEVVGEIKDPRPDSRGAKKYSSTKRSLMGIDSSNNYYVYRVTFDNPTGMVDVPREGAFRALLNLDVIKESSLMTLEYASHSPNDCFMLF